MAYKVTTTDRTLIRLLQHNARASFAELSRSTGIPESTVRRRVERLQDRGVITFSMAADPATLGYEIAATIGLKVDLPRLDAIGEELRAMPQVTFAAFAMGSLDVLLNVVVRSQGELVNLLRAVADIDGVRTTETFLMPAVLKPATAWVIPEADADDAPETEPGDVVGTSQNGFAESGFVEVDVVELAGR